MPVIRGDTGEAIEISDALTPADAARGTALIDQLVKDSSGELPAKDYDFLFGELPRKLRESRKVNSHAPAEQGIRLTFRLLRARYLFDRALDVVDVELIENLKRLISEVVVVSINDTYPADSVTIEVQGLRAHDEVTVYAVEEPIVARGPFKKLPFKIAGVIEQGGGR